MRGKNILTFNHATMVEAVQMYLSNQFDKDHVPHVESVKYDNTSERRFVVEVTDENDEEKGNGE
jgi:hypothetical protein